MTHRGCGARCSYVQAWHVHHLPNCRDDDDDAAAAAPAAAPPLLALPLALALAPLLALALALALAPPAAAPALLPLPPLLPLDGMLIVQGTFEAPSLAASLPRFGSAQGHCKVKGQGTSCCFYFNNGGHKTVG
jgi:hypothetical protein